MFFPPNDTYDVEEAMNGGIGLGGHHQYQQHHQHNEPLSAERNANCGSNDNAIGNVVRAAHQFREFNQNLYMARRKLKRLRQRQYRRFEANGRSAHGATNVMDGDSAADNGFMALRMGPPPTSASASALTLPVPPAVIRT